LAVPVGRFVTDKILPLSLATGVEALPLTTAGYPVVDKARSYGVCGVVISQAVFDASTTVMYYSDALMATLEMTCLLLISLFVPTVTLNALIPGALFPYCATM